jgi:hypothetical protein
LADPTLTEAELTGMAEKAQAIQEYGRLKGKAEGIRLTLSYLDEYTR